MRWAHYYFTNNILTLSALFGLGFKFIETKSFFTLF